MSSVSKSAGMAPASAPGPSEAGPRNVVLRDGSLTVARLIDAYMAEYAGRDGTRVQRLGWWQDRIGHLTLAQLDDDHVFEAMEELAHRPGAYFAGRDIDGRPIMRAKRRPLSPATQNRYQAALSAALTWAQRRRIAPKGWSNPCRHVALKPERNERVRFLSDEERERLLAACRASKWDRLYLLVLMALSTGGRKSELTGLKWADIDLDRAEARVARTKNNDPKIMPLIPAVVAELRRLQGSPSALVFASKRRPGQPFSFEFVWDRALRAAGVKNFRFHDLRHSFASSLAQAGAPLLSIADAMGHKQLSMSKRYAHLTTQNRSDMVNKILGGIR